ncbi:CDP-glucose 4,6-dehydratase [Clostridia bacterium]|nr:CDP-glucose 4,6-dehydratase [Clostridia bacterium]
MGQMVSRAFWKGKRVFLTGHTGFKGGWLAEILKSFGAEICGYSLTPPTNPSFFEIVSVGRGMRSIVGDIRDYGKLKAAFDQFQPEIVLHLAAQPLVRESYADPRSTYETNVMGTVNLLECVRKSATVRSFLNVTTDKVYLNREWEWGYREDEPLDGYDPYSNSKSCSELATHGYRNSFFKDQKTAVSTARAGNVIGGGDFAVDRIIPDCVRAALGGRAVEVRNPHSTRPYQHVLEPLFAYLLIAERQYGDPEFADWYNVGPDESDCVATGKLAECFCRAWGEGLKSAYKPANGPHEANFLKLDCSRIKARFGWRPVWSVETAIQKTVEWSKAHRAGKDMKKTTAAQIRDYTEAAND